MKKFLFKFVSILYQSEEHIYIYICIYTYIYGEIGSTKTTTVVIDDFFGGHWCVRVRSLIVEHTSGYT